MLTHAFFYAALCPNLTFAESLFRSRRIIDDLFHISRELIVIIVVGIIQSGAICVWANGDVDVYMCIVCVFLPICCLLSHFSASPPLRT